MSAEFPRSNAEMLQDVHDSTYGWSWIGSLEVPEAQKGIRVRYDIVPNRPAASDVGNPFVLIGDYFATRTLRRQRAVKQAESMALGSAQRAITEAEAIVKAVADRVQEDIFRDARLGLIDPKEF